MRSLIAAFAVAAVSLAGTGTAQAQKYTWRMTTYVPEGTSTYRDYAQVFIDNVHQMTDGEVKIQGYGVGILSGFADGWKAVQQGTADIAYMYPGVALNVDPTNAVFGGFPGGLSAEGIMHWVYMADGGKIWGDFRRATLGLHAIATGVIPTEIFMHSHKKVEKLEDLKGMRIRTAGAWADIVKKFGATPVTLAPTDIFAALERKVVDATEFITPASNVSQGYHKVARYIVIPGVHAPGGLNEVVWKAEVWDALPKPLQEKLTKATKLAAMETYMRVGMADLDAIAEMKKGRNEWVNLSPEFITQVRAEGRKWGAEKAKELAAAGNPWMQRITESYFAFQDKWESDGGYRMK